jgi:hypothetical protein
MKITEVQAFLMSYAPPKPMRLPFRGGERTILKRDAMLIRVKTDTGLDSGAKTGARCNIKWFHFRQLLGSRMLLGVYFGQFCITTLTYFFIQW